MTTPLETMNYKVNCYVGSIRPVLLLGLVPLAYTTPVLQQLLIAYRT